MEAWLRSFPNRNEGTDITLAKQTAELLRAVGNGMGVQFRLQKPKAKRWSFLQRHMMPQQERHFRNHAILPCLFASDAFFKGIYPGSAFVLKACVSKIVDIFCFCRFRSFIRARANDNLIGAHWSCHTYDKANHLARFQTSPVICQDIRDFELRVPAFLGFNDAGALLRAEGFDLSSHVISPVRYESDAEERVPRKAMRLAGTKQVRYPSMQPGVESAGWGWVLSGTPSGVA